MLGALLNLIRKHNGVVNVAIDCSLSTTEQNTQVAYAAVLQSVLSAITDRSGVVIFFTHEVEKIMPINQLLEFGIYNMLKTIPPAGGDLTPVYGFLSVAAPSDLLVVITDGYIITPPQPHFPVAWALVGSPQYTEPCYREGNTISAYGSYFHVGGDHINIVATR